MKTANLPPLGPLVSFCAAARHQSFSKAARELNLTHGAVSRAVQQLEQHFGVALFQRRNRRVYLTDKGRFFAERAGALLEELAEASEQVRTEQACQRLAVSCEPTLAMRWLMPRLGRFHESFAELDVQLSTAGGPVDLAAQNLDLAIRRSDFQWPADYWVTPLARERVGPVCHPDYLNRLQGKPAERLHSRTRPEAWQHWLGSSGQTVDSGAEKYFDHFYFSLQAAVAGLGIAIGPEPLVRDDIDQGHLVAPWGFIDSGADYVVLSLKNPARDGPAGAFVNWLVEQLSAAHYQPD
ncbi:LysR substrate-binding domain-containing protein [Marinobacterium arenosum]|uniref:LysR substrate-binding domain-containing protein n=1 Tax=Marinobacterium arenosum TaxID=2862496 RepID=UPI001C93ECF8|nr:LysR substrate-binding domain-containing protein [Marinobacterium arenosum]MBY4678661.1 LysR family transcriptional regulator [Marinobacterium arenosum]